MLCSSRRASLPLLLLQLAPLDWRAALCNCALAPRPRSTQLYACRPPASSSSRRLAMSLGIKLSTPTQCATQTITWSGPPVRKGVAMWVQGTNYFAEVLSDRLTDTLGTLEWVCDVPAGAWIAFETFDLGNATNWAASQFYQVQPGTTDECLRTNEGQKAVESMAALASSLSSASPQLFTYPPTTTRTLIPATTKPLSSSSTSLSPTDSASSSSSLDVGALAGGIAGGVLGILALAAMLFLLFRRRARRRRHRENGSSVADTEKAPGVPPARAPAGFFRTMSMSGNPVDAWRNRVQTGAPPSARTRALSGATTVGGALSPFKRSAGAAGAPAQQQSQQHSLGPRVGVPEVGEAGDHEAHRRGGAAGQLGGYGALPLASASATRLLEAHEGGGPEAFMARPPTRLTTPGGLTEFGGGAAEAVRGRDEGGQGYASYARGA
ncbi:hypothetical protein JCM9279_004962 [Rhodotorula babjevae]